MSALNGIPMFSDIVDSIVNIMYVMNKYLNQANHMLSKSTKSQVSLIICLDYSIEISKISCSSEYHDARSTNYGRSSYVHQKNYYPE